MTDLHLPVLLAILDGVGWSPDCPTNAVTRADAPFLHSLFSDTTYPCRTIEASGRSVGLPDGQMGNSEVGHLNIGAGRIVNQELTRIDIAIEDGTFATNPVFAELFAGLVQRQKALHLMGLLSDGGVHSSLEHLKALIASALSAGVRQIRIHAFLDGRDVSPTSGAGYLEQLMDFISTQFVLYPAAQIAIGSVVGRYYAMDRDNRWERIERAFTALVDPQNSTATKLDALADPAQAVRDSYATNVSDEFVEPVVFGDQAIIDGDGIVFFNFRPDRARQLTRAFIDPDFANYGFVSARRPQVEYVCMTLYDPQFAAEFNARVAFDKEFPGNVLADYLAASGLRQLHIAETEKYAHVTFFFNGGKEPPKQGEQRILIDSPKVATYDLKPQMSAFEVAAALSAAIDNDAADVYIVNFANGDMVGHTGDLDAAKAAVAAVDQALKQVLNALAAKGGQALVTADHGNAEQMVDAEGNPWTAHTLNPVPLVFFDPKNADRRIDFTRDEPACLADIAPTLVAMIGLDTPPEWTGRNLLASQSQ